MDPISITTTVTTLVFNIVKNGRQLALLYRSYQDAQNTLFMIQTECSVVAAALSQIQAHFGTRDGSVRVRPLPEAVVHARDLSLTAASMTLQC